MDDDYFSYIGNRLNWGGEAAFGLSRADRRQHVYTIGKTGTGKTTLLRNLIIQDIEAGHGVGVIDPHGDLANELLDHIPPWRTDHLVYFNPGDQDYPIGFNLLQNVPPAHRHRIASGLVGAFKSIWRDSWGPRTEYILYAAVAALLDCENVSILGIYRMLIDDQYRRWVVRQVQDPMVRLFWAGEFENYDEKFRREAVAPIQNKVGQLLMSPPIRNVLGQVRRKVDARFMMDDRRIFIANLSKGLLGEDKANLLGSILVTAFQLAAMERVTVPERERRDFFLYIDEFQNFTTDAFVSILSEARKYRLCLTLSHQYIEQIRPDIRPAIFGNVGSIIGFRVGESDARVLAQEFGGGYNPAHFSTLSNFEVCAKLLNSGGYGDPFLGKTFPPLPTHHGHRDTLIHHCRQKYATPRTTAEEKIRRWLRN